MKTKITFCILMLSAFGLFAQTETNTETTSQEPIQTLITPDTKVGFNVAFDNLFTQINGQQSYFSGVRLGFTFNRYLFVGAGGFGLVNNTTLKDWIFDGEDLLLESGFGGLVVEPILFPRKPVHLTFPIIAGPGVAVFRDRTSRYDWLDRDMFWAVNAGAQVELNVTRWLRVSGGVHYMQTYDLELESTKSNLLDGIQYGFSLKIGAF